MALSLGALSRIFSQKCRVACASVTRQGLLVSGRQSPPWTQRYQEFSSDLPPKPKRPISSFFQFTSEQRPKILALEPEMSNPDVVKRVAALWKEMTDSEKEVYRLEFESRLSRFHEEMEDFKSRLTDEQLDTMLEMSRMKRKMKAKRKQKLEMKKLNKPKRPPTGYSLFVRAHLTSALRPAGGSRTAEERQGMFKDAAEKWNSLPDHEKQHYNEEASRLLAMYREELEGWKRRMEDEGHSI